MNPNQISLVGHFDSILGVGEAARRLARLLFAAGFDTFLTDLKSSKSKRVNDSTRPQVPNQISTQILCVNADLVAPTISAAVASPWEIENLIGFWSWELEEAPVGFKHPAKLLDQIWTVSDFAKNSLQRATLADVKTVQLPVPVRSHIKSRSRSLLGIPKDKHLALTSFDFFSDINRKNPKASIEAFVKATAGRQDCMMIVKSINGDKAKFEFEKLREEFAHDARIIFHDGYITFDQNLNLISAADVFISLHRAEGYGINLIDAMSLGTPVVATGYSGNLQFMNESNSLLVPFDLVSVSNYAGMRVNSRWAEPKVDSAATSIERVLFDSKFSGKFASNVRNAVNEDHGLAASVYKFQKAFTHE
jgi:glycosyltransferase involved in cell wall biosynthesis